MLFLSGSELFPSSTPDGLLNFFKVLISNVRSKKNKMLLKNVSVLKGISSASEFTPLKTEFEGNYITTTLYYIIKLSLFKIKMLLLIKLKCLYIIVIVFF